MSQPSTPFTGTASDPCLPSIDLESCTQEQLEELFGSSGSHHPVFSANNTSVLDELDFDFTEPSVSNETSIDVSTISTPDFSTYSFDPRLPQATHPHPHTTANAPQPSPLDQQQHHHYAQAHQHHAHGPLPIRSHTQNNPTFPSSQLPQSYTCRGSLSQPNLPHPPNPTFIRLQAPRARSVTPEEKRRGAGPYARHGYAYAHARSASHGPSGARGRVVRSASPWIGLGGLMPTSIGQPLDEEGNVVGREEGDEGMGMDEDLLVRHMTDPTRLAHSRRIIEIGAMAVRKHSLGQIDIDPRLLDDGEINAQDRMIMKLEEVERHLRHDGMGNEDALKGCEMIREALIRRRQSQYVAGARLEEGGEKGGMDEQEDKLEAPSKIMCNEDEELFGGCMDDNDFMSLLLKENEQLDSDHDNA
ncbi:hypothetical protein EK21DRAFT_90440 [Setomelanomma holmii]|uniref:Uncharacterized protein n=1 Tax=Setomelanomma holmii TaxID=210430 RepID=A0A9P4LKW0_9PLEO|nr:hypothetical protein EK21DRAFT_90440 [Setomelanomma holmii]